MKNFRGRWNWYGEILTLYSHATTAPEARQNMIQQLSKKLGRSAGPVRAYFFNSNRVKIEEVNG